MTRAAYAIPRRPQALRPAPRIFAPAQSVPAAPALTPISGAELRTPLPLSALMRAAKLSGQGLLALRGAANDPLTPPSGPTDPAWEVVADLGGDGSAFLEFTVQLPTDDDAYPLALYSTTLGTPAATAFMVYGFGVGVVEPGPRGATFVSLLIPTNRPAYPRIEVSPLETFPSPTVYDAILDGPTGWRLVPSAQASEMADPAVGTALPAGGFPAGSAGMYARRAISDGGATYYMRGQLVGGG